MDKSKTYKLSGRLRSLWYSLWYVVVTALVVAAIGLSLARNLLPMAENYKPNIEAWASQVLGQELQINSLSADWQGLEPQLVLEGVNLQSEQQTLIHFGKVRIGLDLVASIRQWLPVPGSLVVEQAKLSVVRDNQGKISVVGVSGGKGGAAREQDILATWLFSQDLLQIKNSQLVWHDQLNHRQPWQFSDINLHLEKRLLHHNIIGSVKLPSILGDRLRVFVELKGNPLIDENWSARVFSEGSDLELAHWLPQNKQANIELARSRLSLQSWSEWQNGRLLESRGELLATELHLRRPGKPQLVSFENIAAQFLVKQQEESWQFALEQLIFFGEKESSTPASLQGRLRLQPFALDLTVDVVPVEQLLALHHLTRRDQQLASDFIENARPQADIRDLIFHLETGQRTRFQVSARFNGVVTRPWHQLPGVEELNGRVTASNEKIKLWLNSQQLQLRQAQFFEKGLSFTNIQATLELSRNDQGWQVDGRDIRLLNPFMRGNGYFAIKTTEASPIIDLGFNFATSDTQKLADYLPKKVIPQATYDWIQQSIGRGQLENGRIVMYGALRDFPYRKGNGRFDIQFDLRRFALEHTPGWPVIRDIHGHFHYDGRGLRFNASKGRALAAPLSNVSVLIEDFRQRPLMLEIQGQAAGKTQTLLDYAHASPLQDLFARHLEPFRFNGNSELQLGLQIPLGKEHGNALKVNGLVRFDNNDISAEDYKLFFSELSGDLQFNERFVSSPALNGFLGGIPLSVTVDTQQAEQGKELRFNHSGDLDSNQARFLFANFLDSGHWADYLSGKARFDIDVLIPFGNSNGERKTRLRVASKLDGLAIHLPVPLAKDAGRETKLDVSADLNGLKRQIQISYDQHHALLELSDDKPGVERGGIAFNGRANLPDEHGFRYQGRLAHVDWREWSRLLIPDEGQTPLFAGGPGIASHFFDMDVGQLDIYGLHFSNQHISLSNAAQGWTLHSHGEQLRGTIFIPTAWHTLPVSGDLKRLHLELKETGKGDGRALDPRKFPQMRLTAEDVRFGNMNLGKIEIHSSRTSAGLHLDRFNAQTKETTTKAVGNWEVRDGEQQSEFQIKVTSRNLGRTFREWDYADTIRGGRAKLDINGVWAGQPADFSLNRLDGKVVLKVKDGRLLNVSPGAARMFGLLSLQALPRRLTLDFKDVFAKGTSFDIIEGDFNIRHGHAYTNNLVLDGPPARIEMAGRIGLADQDYDQVVTIIPRIGDSIPVLGALTIDPTIGATLWVFQKLFQQQIDDISRVQYTVTGKWDDPVVEKVEPNPVESQEKVIPEIE